MGHFSKKGIEFENPYFLSCLQVLNGRCPDVEPPKVKTAVRLCDAGESRIQFGCVDLATIKEKGAKGMGSNLSDKDLLSILRDMIKTVREVGQMLLGHTDRARVGKHQLFQCSLPVTSYHRQAFLSDRNHVALFLPRMSDPEDAVFHPWNIGLDYCIIIDQFDIGLELVTILDYPDASASASQIRLQNYGEIMSHGKFQGFFRPLSQVILVFQ